MLSRPGKYYGVALLLGLVTIANGMRAMDALKESDRVVFLGDSITDGFTYPLLMQQALREAGLPVPHCINAGVGGDTAEQAFKRLERDVLEQKPTLGVRHWPQC